MGSYVVIITGGHGDSQLFSWLPLIETVSSVASLSLENLSAFYHLTDQLPMVPPLASWNEVFLVAPLAKKFPVFNKKPKTQYCVHKFNVL